MAKYSAHQTAMIDEGARIGEGTKIWHYSHIASDAEIGKDCKIGQNVYIASGEIVKCDVPDRSVVYKGKIIPGNKWRGKLRESGFFEWKGNQ